MAISVTDPRIVKNGEPINCFNTDSPVPLTITANAGELSAYFNVQVNGTFVLTNNKPFAFSNNTATIDIAPYTLPYLSASITYDPLALDYVNYVDILKNCTAQLYVYDSLGVQLTTSLLLNFCKSANQIGNVNGGNLAELIGVYDAPDMEQGQFLTKFPTPRFWVGYPATLSFIPLNQYTSVQVGVSLFALSAQYLKVNNINIDTDTATNLAISLV